MSDPDEDMGAPNPANIDHTPDPAAINPAESTTAATHPTNEREQQQQQQKKLRASQKVVIYQQNKRSEGEEKVNELKNVVKGLVEEVDEWQQVDRLKKNVVKKLEASAVKTLNTLNL